MIPMYKPWKPVFLCMSKLHLQCHVHMTSFFFFLSGFSFTDTDDSRNSRGREGTIFYSTLPLPPAHEHWDIYLQLCMWDDYHIFNRNACIYQTATRWDFPTLSNYHLIDDGKFDLTCLLDDLILGFCYSNLDTRNQWTRTRINYHPCITSKLTNQANRLTKFCSVWSSQWKTTPFDLRWFCRKDILIS